MKKFVMLIMRFSTIKLLWFIIYFRYTCGVVRYRKKAPFLESHVWDRCDFVKHGELIYKIITDIDKPVGADINAGLLVACPIKMNMSK